MIPRVACDVPSLPHDYYYHCYHHCCFLLLLLPANFRSTRAGGSAGEQRRIYPIALKIKTTINDNPHDPNTPDDHNPNPYHNNDHDDDDNNNDCSRLSMRARTEWWHNDRNDHNPDDDNDDDDIDDDDDDDDGCSRLSMRARSASSAMRSISRLLLAMKKSSSTAIT